MRTIPTPVPFPILALLLGATGCTLPDAPQSPGAVYIQHVYIEGSYDDVWRHLTTKDGFRDWYTVPCRQFDSTPGCELVWGTADRVVYRGRLLEIEKGRGVAWEFRFVGFDFDEPMARVDIGVVECGPTVLVSARHDLTAAPATAAMISPVGWAKPLSRLKTLIETGKPMPWPVDSVTER